MSSIWYKPNAKFILKKNIIPTKIFQFPSFLNDSDNKSPFLHAYDIKNMQRVLLKIDPD